MGRGYDNIPTNFIKTNTEILAPLLVQFINQSLLDGKFPDSLKISRITPIFKKQGDQTDPNNYRPISVIPSFSKIYEKIIKTRLLEHLKDNNIINPKQYGFIEKSNTTTAAACLANAIHETLNDGKKCAVIFIDVVKAFDCINFKTLKKILTHVRITENAQKLLVNYFQNSIL